MSERVIYDAGEEQFWRYIILEKDVNGIYRERYAATVLQDAIKLIEDMIWGDALHEGGVIIPDKKAKKKAPSK